MKIENHAYQIARRLKLRAQQRREFRAAIQGRYFTAAFDWLLENRFIQYEVKKKNTYWYLTKAGRAWVYQVETQYCCECGEPIPRKDKDAWYRGKIWCRECLIDKRIVHTPVSPWGNSSLAECEDHGEKGWLACGRRGSEKRRG